MTWAEWLRAIFAFDVRRRRTIDDLKLGAFLTAALMRQRRLPSLRHWMAERKTRVVVGAERERLRAERRYVEQELAGLLEKRRKKKPADGNQRSTRRSVR